MTGESWMCYNFPYGGESWASDKTAEAVVKRRVAGCLYIYAEQIAIATLFWERTAKELVLQMIL